MITGSFWGTTDRSVRGIRIRRDARSIASLVIDELDQWQLLRAKELALLLQLIISLALDPGRAAPAGRSPRPRCACSARRVCCMRVRIRAVTVYV